MIVPIGWREGQSKIDHKEPEGRISVGDWDRLRVGWSESACDELLEKLERVYLRGEGFSCFSDRILERCPVR